MSTARPCFPVTQIPDEPAVAKLLGLYPQSQDGLWLQRVRILGGILIPAQWRALARIAERFSPNTPLHLTTRQDIEIHDLRAGDVPLVQREMAGAELTSVGAAGDTVRNITVCPCSGSMRGLPDLVRLARDLDRLLETQEGIYSLPRKFKISLSACTNGCAQPFINDLGFSALQREGRWGFRVIGAGSLGARPNTGIQLFEWVPPEDVPALVLGAVRVFAEHGDRTNRTKARLRHVRERVGDAAFISLLSKAFANAKTQYSWPEISLDDTDADCTARVEISFPAGDVTPQTAKALADLADEPGIHMRISNHHRVIVLARDKETLARQMARFPGLVRASVTQLGIVACPGSRWCNRGLTDTASLARRISGELADMIPAGTTVCISGCPNGCAHSSVGDIGLTGVLTTQDGRQREAWNMLAGGGMGRDERLARLVAQRLTADDVIARIAAGPTEIT